MSGHPFQITACIAAIKQSVSFIFIQHQRRMNAFERTRFCTPCPARSVSIDHNAETAYFDVAHGTSHGTRLICKHPDCAKKQSRRPRFRYCAFCRSAVSYKNFNLRHSHVGEPNPSKNVMSLSKGSSTTRLPNTSSQLCQPERRWLDLLREHPALLGYGADDMKKWMDAVQAVAPVAFQNWMSNILMLPLVALGSIEISPLHFDYNAFSSSEDARDPTEYMDESVKSTTSSGYFSDF